VLLLASTALALPLLVERFDANALPDGWKTAVATQIGGGKPSEASVADGALVLTAGPKTKKFTAISRKFELRDVAYLKVQARVRTEGVDAAAANGVCGVFVRFEGGQLTQAGPCAAADWASFTRTFVVPDGARDVEVGFLLSTAGTARFDDLLVEPVAPDWKGVNRGGFTYAWLGGDTFREDQLVANDETFDRAVALVGAPPKERVTYRKYANLDAIEEYTGVRAEHVATAGMIHTVVRTDAYAILKALAPVWARPPPSCAKASAWRSSASGPAGTRVRRPARSRRRARRPRWKPWSIPSSSRPSPPTWPTRCPARSCSGSRPPRETTR
jgi:hypothetical protein